MARTVKTPGQTDEDQAPAENEKQDQDQAPADSTTQPDSDTTKIATLESKVNSLIERVEALEKTQSKTTSAVQIESKKTQKFKFDPKRGYVQE